MPLNFSHNRYGDYTPLTRTLPVFSSLTLESDSGLLLDLDEISDRPHFGVDPLTDGISLYQKPVGSDTER